MKLNNPQQSPHSRKVFGFAFGLIPLLAGMLGGNIVGMWHEVWIEAHRRATRFSRPNDSIEFAVMAVILTLVCVLLSGGSWLLCQILGDLELGMSRTAWRILFLGLGLTGYAITMIA